jgi:hypothetical protein
MSASIPEVWGPLVSLARLDRLDVDVPPPPPGGQGVEVYRADWDEVHRAVQEEFRLMDELVRRQAPAIRSRAGKTSGRSFPLFTYRAFDLGEGEEIDPVIVGVQITTGDTGDRVLLQGDISGEGTGRIDYEAAEREVVNDRYAVLAAALGMANELRGRTDVVIGSVLDRHPPPTY